MTLWVDAQHMGISPSFSLSQEGLPAWLWEPGPSLVPKRPFDLQGVSRQL